jgi:hypothetical protein
MILQYDIESKRIDGSEHSHVRPSQDASMKRCWGGGLSTHRGNLSAFF